MNKFDFELLGKTFGIIFFLCIVSYGFFSPDPFRFYSKYPTIDSVEQIKRFEVGDDKNIIQKEIGEGYETSTLNNDGVWHTSVVYKRIKNREIKLVRFYYSDEKLTSVVIK